MVNIKDIIKYKWMSQFTENAIRDDYSNVLKSIKRNNYIPIQCAFTWVTTPQGYDYWFQTQGQYDLQR